MILEDQDSFLKTFTWPQLVFLLARVYETPVNNCKKLKYFAPTAFIFKPSYLHTRNYC